ncbi:MAG: dihydropteroate synthase [Hyphomicrobiales bacterium]
MKSKKLLNKDIVFQGNQTLHCHLKTFDLSEPLIMGILNITPDSFYDGGKYNESTRWQKQTEKMLEESADIIDIGAISTRPGSDDVSEEEEKARIIPVIKQLCKDFPDTVFSVDTFRSNIANEAIQCGASIINDISGGTMDEDMFSTIAKLNVPYILMHIQGTPKTMQNNPITEDITRKVKDFFTVQTQKLNDLNFHNIILDPGYGFGKSLESNYELLNHQDELLDFGYPILTGISRKSMIFKYLQTNPNEALNGTTVLNTLALTRGAKILRVHDVKEAKEVVKLYNVFTEK